MTDQNDDLPGEMPDLGGLLEQAQNMMAASAEAAEAIVEGTAGGGMVSVRVNGNFEFEAVSIQPAAVDPGDVGMLEDLVLAALRDAATKIAAGQQDLMGGLDLGGLDLGGLLGGDE